jgi:DNA invertase Pin-like site-specific DNA recombinase
MIYGYARVSTQTQAKDGNSLENQTNAILSAYPTAEVYTEAFTGMTTERPKLSKILEKIKKGDTLVVTKLDRFSRSASEGVGLINKLHAEGVVVEILNMGKVDNSPMGKLMVTMLLAFAEFEHDNIVERLSEGKAVAKSHGKRTEGRLKKEPVDFQKFLKLQKGGSVTVDEACEKLKIGRTTWYKLAKEVSG